ncbi:MAG: ABC transporter permease [Candidatus Kariarchaeaceae archaeon]|jgi:ABC-2 type transport system permease protein
MNETGEESRKPTRKKNRLVSLTVKNLKTMFRDKGNMAWIILYPLFFILIFGVAFGGAGAAAKYDIIIINHDVDGIVDPEHPSNFNFTNASLTLFSALGTENLSDTIVIKGYNNYTETAALEEVRYERIHAVIIIHVNFSEALYNATGYEDHIPIIDITTIADAVVSNVVTSIISQIVNQISVGFYGAEQAVINSELIIDSIQLGVMDLMVPGFIMAGVLVCVSQLATHFAEEKEKKTMERLSTTPVPKRDIILSGLISQLTVAAFQITLMIFLATQVFGSFVHPDANWFLIFLLPILFTFSSLGLGMILASVVKSENSASGFAWLVILPMQFLGGIFTYGVEIPGAQFIPTTYAVHAMRVVMINGAGTWDAIGGDIIFILAFGIITTIIGILLFQRKSAIR